MNFSSIFIFFNTFAYYRLCDVEVSIPDFENLPPKFWLPRFESWHDLLFWPLYLVESLDKLNLIQYCRTSYVPFWEKSCTNEKY